jgi:plastocyanin
MSRRTRAIALGSAVSVAALLPAAASAASKTVYAGPPPSMKQVAAKLHVPPAVDQIADINDFFLHRVTINAGSTVKFQIDGFHTVDFPAKGGSAVGLIVPSGGLASTKDAAGNPFWFSGKLPNFGFNALLAAPSGGKVYTGSKRLDSGLPTGPKPFIVKFNKPGVYKYFCDVHPGMIGYVVVKAKGKRIPSAKQDARALLRQQTVDVKSAIKLFKTTKIPANTVSLGISNKHGVELFAMFPSSLTVKAGTVVTFTMSKDSLETHTATFGPKGYLNALANGFGSPKPPIPGNAVYPSDPVKPIVLTATSHGNGFANTGALSKGNPNGTSSTIQFNQAGTYHFICLIHPFMQGEIIVK